MSVAATAPAWASTLQTTTVRQFLRAVGIALATVSVGCLVYLVERFAIGAKSRCVENPADVMVRVLGMAHFVVGWLYLFTSPRLRNRWAVSRLVVATCIGVVLCTGFFLLGGIRQPLLAMAFYGYFLFHELSDETMFYQVYGDHLPASPLESAFLRTLSRAASMMLFTALASCYLAGALAENHRILRRIPEIVPILGLSVMGAISLALAMRTVIQGHALYGSFRGLVAAHAPLLAVYTLLLAVLVFGSLLGTTGLNFLILIHASVWIAFTRFQLGKRRPQQTGLWTWLRATPVGFLTLHIAVAAGFLVLLMLRVYLWQRTGLMSELLTSHNFVYWGLMHISMSLWSSR